MNILNYASLDSSKRLVESEIILKTRMAEKIVHEPLAEAKSVLEEYSGLGIGNCDIEFKLSHYNNEDKSCILSKSIIPKEGESIINSISIY